MHGISRFYACFGSCSATRRYPLFLSGVFFFFFSPLASSSSRENLDAPGCLKNNSRSPGGKMSDVRLSNGSPTLERTDQRVSDHPKPSACRSLFGSVDHEELKRDLKGHLREMEEADSAKWCFDFANNKPLSNGRLEWELVDCRDVPSFYNGQTRREKGVCSAGNNNVDLNGNHSCVMVTPSEDSDRSDGQMECTEQCTGLRKRPACHDTSAQTKRSHTSSDEVSCPSLNHSAEHTPRKTSPKRQT